MSQPEPTFRHVVAAFAEFLTVATHTILYERKIYPQTSFLCARKYNYAVRQSRHPKVCAWINDAVASVEDEILKCGVNRVAVVIYDKANTPLEKFVFDLSSLPVVSETDLDSPLEQKTENGEPVRVFPVTDMEEQMRASMSRLSNCGATLKPLPKHCTFTIVIELKEDGTHAPVSHPQAWIPAQPAEEVQASVDDHPANGPSRTTPIRAVRAGIMVFEAWIEESKSKDSLSSSGSSAG